MKDKINHAINMTVMTILLLVVLIAPIVLTSVFGYVALTILTILFGAEVAMAVFIAMVVILVITMVKEETK